MKKVTYMSVLLFALTACNSQQENPLLGTYNTPHQTPPFDKIKTGDYEPAFEVAISDALKEISTIANNEEPATFENTIVALDHSAEELGRISAIFFNLNSAHTSPEMQDIAQEVSPKLTQFHNSIYMNDTLFQRVKAVYNTKDSLELNPEQKTLLKETYRAFIKGGANLNDEDKQRYEALSIELSKLGLQFEQNLLEETNSFILNVTDSADLKGLPEGVVEMAAQTAQEKGKEGWVFTLNHPSYIPFMKYAENRKLRETMYRANSSRCNHNNEYDNKEIIRKIVNIRLEMAQIMGYKNYAEMALVNRMAQDTQTVDEFINNLLTPSHEHAIADLKEVQDYAKTLGFNDQIQRWDWAYYSNKLMLDKYALDDEMLKPYFKLENVQKGIFDLASQLYDVTFKEVKNIPVYEENVSTFEVYNKDKQFVGVLYLDFFPRASKGGGAWMTDFRNQHIKDGKNVTPLISIVTNFTKPTATKPSLLSFDEVTTFLHEFGHGLHGMLSQCTYNGTSGTNVYRDFVELPSQIMENWAYEKEWLDKWAVHYETGEAIPAEYIEKIRKSANFQSGYMSDRQLSFGIIDMAWHSITSPVNGDINAFEQKAMAPTEIFPIVEGSNFSVGFGHIFGGGYAAGYYSYKWAEVLDADAFAVFKEKGIFDKATATAFKENILEKGGSEHPMELYKRFRGQEPTVDALLERSGLN